MGVAVRKMIDPETGEEGDLEGIRLPFFNYTGKEVLAIKKYEKKIEEEIQRVKNLTYGKTAGWVVSSRDNDALFHDDCVSVMKGVGAKMKEKLENAGVHKIKDFIFDDTSPPAVKAKLISISDKSTISLTSIQKFYNQASTANPGACPPDTNYLFANNPYEARYGDNWRAEIKKVRFMSKYCDIRDLVRHIHDTTRDAFKGTKHEQTYQFYHDALITMTDKDCLEWMEQEGILKK